MRCTLLQSCTPRLFDEIFFPLLWFWLLQLRWVTALTAWRCCQHSCSVCSLHPAHHPVDFLDSLTQCCGLKA